MVFDEEIAMVFGVDLKLVQLDLFGQQEWQNQIWRGYHVRNTDVAQCHTRTKPLDNLEVQVVLCPLQVVRLTRIVN